MKPGKSHFVIIIGFLFALAAASVQGQWLPQPPTGSGPIYYNGGNVGIGTGTVAPAQKLDVEGAAQDGSPTTVLRVGTTGLAYWGSGGAIELAAMNNRGAVDPVGQISVFLTNAAVNVQTGDLVFSTANGGSLGERLRILSNGNVGIGTAGPAERLMVSGNIRATGNISADGTIYAKYQDVAEWVSASGELAPATVVVLDPSHDDQVMPSARAYDTAVAGVVSASPGMVLGAAAAGKEKIATTGRVLVKVDATRSPVAIGDLLVTSDVAGVAMKSEPIEVAGAKIHRPGTVIGKALQPLQGGRGEILVLLSLQ